MKRTLSALKIAALTVYVLVNAWPDTAYAVGAQYKRFEALVNQVNRARQSHDPRHEDLLENLLAEYKHAKMPQERIWALHANGRHAEAEKLEARLLRLLQSEKIDKKSELEIGRNVFRVKLREGPFAVVRIGGTPYPSIDHDLLVYKIDRLLGFHLVPATVHRKYNGKNVTVQAYITELKQGTVDYKRNPYDQERLHILDYITSQLDRHDGNWGYAPGGYTVAYDNDVVVGSKAWTTLRRHGPSPSDNPPAAISPQSRSGVLRLKHELSKRNGGDLSLSEEDADAMLLRIETLLKPPNSCEANL